MGEKNYKGISICFVRDLVSDQGPEALAQMLAGLDDDDAHVFRYTLATSWIDIHAGMRIIQRAAEVLYPDDPAAIQTIGFRMAQWHLTSVYRILLRVVTVQFALSQTANYWEAYHRKGRTILEKDDHSNKARLIIEKYPDLPDTFRILTDGYIQGIMDLAGARNGTVQRRVMGADRWGWDLSWE